MKDYHVVITAERPPTVSVELYDFDHEPTQEEVAQALEDLSEQLEMDGYLAEFICTEGGSWTFQVEEA